MDTALHNNLFEFWVKTNKNFPLDLINYAGGALGGIRTHNPQLRRLALCPLSYEGLVGDYTIGRMPL